SFLMCFYFMHTSAIDIYTLSLHDALPILTLIGLAKREEELFFAGDSESLKLPYSGESMKLIRYIRDQVHRFGITFHRRKRSKGTDRKSTRLNSSHVSISYAVFCLKKKKEQ